MNKFKVGDLIKLNMSDKLRNDKDSLSVWTKAHLTHMWKVLDISNIECDSWAECNTGQKHRYIKEVECIECHVHYSSTLCEARFFDNNLSNNIKASTCTCPSIALLNGCGCGAFKKDK